MAATLKGFLSPKALLAIFSFSFLYYIGVALSINYRLVFSTLVGDAPLSYKFALLSELISGSVAAFGTSQALLILLLSLLVGFNLVLLYKTIRNMQQGVLRMVFGGSTMLGFVTAGCGSCGLSVLSILGVSTSLTFLPFHGKEIYWLSLGLLLFSSWYMLKTLQQSNVCKRK